MGKREKGIIKNNFTVGPYLANINLYSNYESSYTKIVILEPMIAESLSFVRVFGHQGSIRGKP